MLRRDAQDCAIVKPAAIPHAALQLAASVYGCRRVYPLESKHQRKWAAKRNASKKMKRCSTASRKLSGARLGAADPGPLERRGRRDGQPANQARDRLLHTLHAKTQAICENLLQALPGRMPCLPGG